MVTGSFDGAHEFSTREAFFFRFHVSHMTRAADAFQTAHDMCQQPRMIYRLGELYMTEMTGTVTPTHIAHHTTTTTTCPKTFIAQPTLDGTLFPMLIFFV